MPPKKDLWSDWSDSQLMANLPKGPGQRTGGTDQLFARGGGVGARAGGALSFSADFLQAAAAPPRSLARATTSSSPPTTTSSRVT